MKSLAFAILMSVCVLSVPSYADIVLVAVSDGAATGTDQASSLNYEKEIKRLEQESFKISFETFDKKKDESAKQDAKDGMQVTLVKIH